MKPQKGFGYRIHYMWRVGELELYHPEGYTGTAICVSVANKTQSDGKFWHEFRLLDSLLLDSLKREFAWFPEEALLEPITDEQINFKIEALSHKAVEQAQKEREYATVFHMVAALAGQCAGSPEKVVDLLTGYLWDEEEAGGIKEAGKHGRDMKDETQPETLELDCEVTLRLSVKNLTAAQRFLNKIHTGSETVPLDAKVSEKLSEAHYSINRDRLVTVKVLVGKDGSVSLKKGSVSLKEG